jgi:histidyl-tRNA synthetase
LGDPDPVVDAELILLAHNFYKDLGLPVEIHVNSIGIPEERQKYKTALVEYYRSKRSYLCDDCKQRLNKNPLRLLDCKQERCQPVKEDAPQIIDWLEEESKNHFMKVLEYLDELSVPYVLKSTLVRGLDYYTRTVFEVFPVVGDVEALGAQSALGGGGRYDLLVQEMGGRPAPAAGFSLGVERSVSALKQYMDANQVKPAGHKFDAFLAQLGDQARRRALKTINDLRNSGLKIDYNFSKNSLKSQLETANSLQVPYALILGQKEVQDGTIIIRDMESGVQEIVDQKKVENLLKKKLSRFDDLK